MSNQRKRHTPEQIVRKLGLADRLLGEGKKLPTLAVSSVLPNKLITAGGTGMAI